MVLMSVDPVINATQGQSFSSRWQWNATVGSLVDRPGRMGDWGYINTESAPISYFCSAINNEFPLPFSQWSRASRVLVSL
jgi:hypothetical protein